jgi:hypothetical protein
MNLSWNWNAALTARNPFYLSDTSKRSTLLTVKNGKTISPGQQKLRKKI